MNAPIKIKEPGSTGRTYSFSCTFAGLAALATAATLALSLFFVLGVLVGRGHRPESAIPPIERIMPTEGAAGPGSAGEILKPEELTYSEQLSKKGPEAQPSKPIDEVERKAPEKSKAPEKIKTEDKAKAKAAEQATATAKVEALAAAKTGARPEGKSAVKADGKDEDTQVYDYIYQAASFPDEGQAASFLKRVKAAGLKAGIENGTANGKAWYRVVVFFRGTPAATRGLKEKLGGLGVPKPLMRAKTPL